MYVSRTEEFLVYCGIHLDTQTFAAQMKTYTRKSAFTAQAMYIMSCKTEIRRMKELSGHMEEILLLINRVGG
jgi:hypothetical protein